MAILSSSDSRPTLNYRPDIDGLRAFAVVGVVLFHVFPGRVSGGFIGVDVFFVISGYLITGIIYKSMLNNRFSAADFYARRIRRIFPALSVVLLTVLAFGYFSLFDDEYKQLGLHVFGGSSFSSNLILAAEVGYFDNAAESKPLLHLWSIGVEEQFYIVWPLLIWATFEARKRMQSVLWGVLLLSFMANLTFIGQYPEQVFFNPFTRMWELAIGGLIAISMQERQVESVISIRRANVLAWLGCICLVSSAFLLDRYRLFPGAWALLPTAGTGLLIYTGGLPTQTARILSARALVFVGLISFPLYLWHWPVFVFTKYMIAEWMPITVKIAVILISILLACLTYWFVERPLRNPGRRGRQKVVGLTITLAVIGLIGAWVWQQNGLPQRGSAFLNGNAVQRWPANTEPRYTNIEMAQLLFADHFTMDRDFFLVPSTTGPNQVAIIGDSHANRLAVGLAVDGGNSEKIFNLGRGTCLPLYETDLQANGKPLLCQPLMHNIIDYVAANRDIATVILSGYFNYYLDDRHGAPLISESAFEDAMAKTLSVLAEAGKNTILVGDVPEIELPVAECLARPLKMHSMRDSCAISRAQHRQNSEIALRVIDRMKVRFPKLIVIEPEGLLCDDTVCDIRRNGRLVYMPDGNHLTHEGAKQLGNWLISKSDVLIGLRAGTESEMQNRASERDR